MFSLGVSFLLSAICVFLRDMYYIYGIIILMWTYLTPIMYNFAIIPEKLQVIFKINPMYQFINFAREIILYGRIPSTLSFIACFVAGIVMLIFGALVFKKSQDKFIYYI
jgi:ABC-2 type transport system permease protein